MKAKQEIKDLAKKVQTVSKQLGYDIKLGHALEIVSKVNWNQNWHFMSANAHKLQESSIEENSLEKEIKKNNFKERIDVIDNIVYEEMIIKKYLKSIKNNEFKHKFVFGFNENLKEFLTKDYLKDPHSFSIGSMGMGKSLNMRFSLISHIANNSKNTLYLLIDPLKGMTDFNMFMDRDKFNNIVPVLNNVDLAVESIKKLYEEALIRRNVFSEYKASNIRDYNKKNPNHKMCEIMVFIENFHTIIGSNKMSYEDNESNKDSVAYKLKDLMRIGHSYGINFVVTSQSASRDLLPNAIRVAFSNKMSSYMHRANDYLNLHIDHTGELTMKDTGKFAYKHGFLKTPFIGDDLVEEILRDYYKEADCSTFMNFKSLVDLD